MTIIYKRRKGHQRKSLRDKFVLSPLSIPSASASINNNTTAFLELPVEVRLMIYEQLLNPNGVLLTVSSNNFELGKEMELEALPLMHTCKQIREEVYSLFFSYHDFRFISMEALIHFQSDVGHFTQSVRKISITSNLMNRKVFHSQFPALFQTFPGIEHLTIPAHKRYVTFDKSESWQPVFSLALYGGGGGGPTFRLTPMLKVGLRDDAIALLNASPKLAAGNDYWFGRENQLRFVPAGVEYDQAVSGQFKAEFKRSMIVRLAMSRDSCERPNEDNRERD